MKGNKAMRRGGRAIGIVLAVLLVIEIAVAIIIVQSQPGGFAALTRFDAGFGTEYRQAQEPVVYDLGTERAGLTIENRNGRVEVRGEDTTKVTVNVTKVIRRTSENPSEFNNVKYELRREGRYITLNGRVGVAFGDGRDRVDVVITAPKNAVVSAKTDNGSILIENFKDTEVSHEAETDNGSVTINSVTAKFLKMTSDNGSLTLNDFSGELSAKSDNGRITLQNAELRVLNAETDNGRIEISGKLRLIREGSIKTSNGSVNLRLDPATLPRFDVTTDNGSINLNLPNLNFERKEKKHVTTSGSGTLLKIETDNGSITVSQQL
jgi:DUF4097 and DUF4098 domain-containing protein YvlB